MYFILLVADFLLPEETNLSGVRFAFGRRQMPGVVPTPYPPGHPRKFLHLALKILGKIRIFVSGNGQIKAGWRQEFLRDRKLLAAGEGNRELLRNKGV
jgi:hypothetical protein